jgi:hypothetical protein
MPHADTKHSLRKLFQYFDLNKFNKRFFSERITFRLISASLPCHRGLSGGDRSLRQSAIASRLKLNFAASTPIIPERHKP